MQDEASPVKRPIVHKARPDADPHFEFKDDGTPKADRQEVHTSKGRAHNKGLGLYQDHVLHTTEGGEDDDAPKGDVKRPLGDVTTAIRNDNRQKDFGNQWEMTDDSPAAPKTAPSVSSINSDGTDNSKLDTYGNHIMGDRQKLLKGLDAHWGLYEETPEQYKKENVNVNQGPGIKTSGDGMGGRKGAGRSWGIGDDDDTYKSGSQKKDNRSAESKSFWDF